MISMALAICAIATVTLAAHTTTHAPVKVMSGKQVVTGLPFTYSERVAVNNLAGEDAVMQTQ